MFIGGELITGLVCLGLTQTGALIYFAGVVATTIRDHEKRITKNEEKSDDLQKTVLRVEAREEK